MGNCCVADHKDGANDRGDYNLTDEGVQILAKQDLKPSYTKKQREAHEPKDPAIVFLPRVPSEIISNLKSPCYPIGPFVFDKDESEYRELPILGP